MVLVVQVRFSVMCTPRNLVLLTLSTVELSMVSGGWSPEFLLNLAMQSWVSSMKSSGLSTQPCRVPVLSVVVLEVLWPTQTD